LITGVALLGLVDIDAVHPVGLLLGESEATMSVNVEGGVSNDPSAVIAMIAGAAVDVMFCASLQSLSSLCAC
jgi:hypothetical protein